MKKFTKLVFHLMEIKANLEKTKHEQIKNGDNHAVLTQVAYETVSHILEHAQNLLLEERVKQERPILKLIQGGKGEA